MITFFEKIHWAGYNSLPIALLILVFVILFFVIKFRKYYKVLHILISKQRRSLVFKKWSEIRFNIKNSLFFIGILFITLALLRPQWDKKEEIVEQEGRDLLIALDISRSMLGGDEKPNRLEFAKEKIKKLLYNLSCERVGLILFSGTTIVQCPLTTDYAAFFMFLEQIDAETISSGTTAIDQAIRQAIAVYDTMSEKKTKLVCIFTDGEDFSKNLAGIKEKAAGQGLSIVTFGIGTEHGAPIPIIDKDGKQIGFEKNSDGSVIMSKLNEGILKNLSKQTGGAYIHATESDEDIKEAISLVGSFEKDKLEDKTVGRLQEKYYYFVGISFICFALEWLL